MNASNEEPSPDDEFIVSSFAPDAEVEPLNFDPDQTLAYSKGDLGNHDQDGSLNRSFYTWEDEREDRVTEMLQHQHKFNTPIITQNAKLSQSFEKTTEKQQTRWNRNQNDDLQQPFDLRTVKKSRNREGESPTPISSPTHTDTTFALRPKNRISEAGSDDLRGLSLQSLASQREEELLKPIFFNVMVVGETGLGKSTFVSSFLNRRFKCRSVSRYPKSERITEHKGEREEGSLKFCMKLVDTCGYNSDGSNIGDYYKTLKEYITTKFTEYQKDLQLQRLRKNTLFWGDMKMANQDGRIHACLYFVSGGRLQSHDINLMKKISKYTSIIPVIAKGDTLTVEEIREAKESLSAAAKAQKLEWITYMQGTNKSTRRSGKQFYPNSNKFGGSPPFAVSTSNEKVLIGPDQYVYGRKYTWGTCNQDDPEHSEFLLLYKLLIGYYSLECVKLTNYYFTAYCSKKKKKLTLKIDGEKDRRVIALGTAFAFGIIGTMATLLK